MVGDMEVCPMIMKGKLVCLMESSKESAITVGRLVINQRNVEHQAGVHMQVKVVETGILTRI